MTQESQFSDLPNTQTQELTQELLTPTAVAPRPWGQLVPQTRYFETFDLFQEQIVWGRAYECDINVNKNNYNPKSITVVSKKHFKITRLEPCGPILIEDCSKNGTFLNEVLIGRNNKHVLMDEDVIAIGTPNTKLYKFCHYGVLKSDLSRELGKKYFLAKIIGTGACGQVHLAYEKKTCNQFAIKRIQKGESLSTRHLNHPTKIKQEIEILKTVNHPFIIKVKEIIDGEFNVFIVLEYMGGGELGKRIPQLSESEAKRVFYQLVLGVRHLHRQGIIHRDLKPENILLTSKSNQYIVKITDFGLSKIIEDQQLMETICGTRPYVAPEVFNKQPYNHKVDVWSLGVILFQMLMKKLPFELENGRPKIGELQWGSSKQLISGVAKDLIRKMLQLNPDVRLSISEILKHPWIDRDVAMQHRVHELFANNVGVGETSGVNLDRHGDDGSPPPAKRRRPETDSTFIV